MRRVLPWALVGLVTVAGSVGALVGVANQPPAPLTQPKLSEVLSATRAAGTARFTYSSVATSRNPLLRTGTVGKGAVDFRTDSVTTVDRSTSLSISHDGNAPSRQITQTMLNDQISINRTFYTQFGIAGQHFAIGWIEAELPSGSSGLLSMLDEVAPIGFLDSELGVRGTKVERLRSEVLAGEDTTKYRVVVPTCSSVGSPRRVLGSIDLWLDDQGRLVQVRDVLHSTDPVLSLAGRSTTVSTVRLFNFGAPVTISAPKAVLPAGQGGVSFISLSPKACPK
jgi:hypothetical protein